MSENNQKIKLLKILEYLRAESSQENPSTTKQLIKYLESIGTTCDRRTLYKDMEMLTDSCSDIIKTEVGRENAYYIENTNFSLAELKILIDAVQAANFITSSKTEELIGKILSMAGVRKQEIIKDNIIFYNNHKHTNEEIFDNIEQIEQAIKQKKQISFYYFDLGEDRIRIYRHDKKRYIADPIALVYNEDNYYLLSYSQEYSDNRNYRVDRMEAVETEDSPICSEAIIRKRKSDIYMEQVFKMYNGETKTVTFELDREYIKYIYDKFGEHTKIKKGSGNKVTAKVDVQISPPFKAWVYQFGGRIKVIEPEDFDIKID